VARMKDRRGAYRVLVRDLKERCRREHLGVNGRKMLKRILKKRDGGTDWIGLFFISLCICQITSKKSVEIQVVFCQTFY
jgi:hypothetical protein